MNQSANCLDYLTCFVIVLRWNRYLANSNGYCHLSHDRPDLNRLNFHRTIKFVSSTRTQYITISLWTWNEFFPSDFFASVFPLRNIFCSISSIENFTQNHFTHWEISLNSLLSNIRMRILHFSPDAMFFRRNISPPEMLLSFRICLNAKYSKQLAMRHRHRWAHICLVRYISCHDRSGVAESVHEICCCLI